MKTEFSGKSVFMMHCGPQWRCIITSSSYYRWLFFLYFSLFLLFFISNLFSSTSVLLLFFLYSSISFSLPPFTPLPLENFLHLKHLASRREPIQLRKLLTEERLDLREVGSVTGGAFSLKTL